MILKLHNIIFFPLLFFEDDVANCSIFVGGIDGVDTSAIVLCIGLYYCFQKLMGGRCHKRTNFLHRLGLPKKFCVGCTC